MEKEKIKIAHHIFPNLEHEKGDVYQGYLLSLLEAIFETVKDESLTDEIIKNYSDRCDKFIERFYFEKSS